MLLILDNRIMHSCVRSVTHLKTIGLALHLLSSQDLSAQLAEEMSLRSGERVLVTEFVDAMWVRARSEDGSKSGLVPKAFLRFQEVRHLGESIIEVPCSCPGLRRKHLVSPCEARSSAIGASCCDA